MDLLQKSFESQQMKQSSSQNQQQKQVLVELSQLNKICMSVNQSLQNNINMRMKYPQQPEKFFPSQQSLNQQIQKLSSLNQQQFAIIIQSNILIVLLKLLEHPNVDLNCGVLRFLFDLFEEQPSDDKLFQMYFRTVVTLVEQQFLQRIVLVLIKLDQQNNIEQYQVAFKILKLIEIFLNIHQQTYAVIAEDQRVFEYLANRIMPNFITKHKILDDNKYLSSDILISILSNNLGSQTIFTSYSGLQVLLQVISSYQKSLPQQTDEKQFLNNIFSCLSILLSNYTLKQNKKSFHQMKANYLMVGFLKNKTQYSIPAFKVIATSFLALDSQYEIQAVHALIQDAGLKYVFAVLRRKGIRGEDVDQQKAIDQHCLAIVYYLIRSAQQVFKDRVEHKISQNNFENLQRIFQLRSQYAQTVGKQLQAPTLNSSQYLQKHSQGLCLIQLIDKILLMLSQKYIKIRPKLKRLMKQYGLRVKDIQKVIKQHYEYLGLKEEKQWVEGMLGSGLVGLKMYCQKEEKGQLLGDR